MFQIAFVYMSKPDAAGRGLSDKESLLMTSKQRIYDTKVIRRVFR